MTTEPSDPIEALSEEYRTWLAVQGLPDACAEEIILREDLTSSQRSYVSDFILRWEKAFSAEFG